MREINAEVLAAIAALDADPNFVAFIKRAISVHPRIKNMLRVGAAIELATETLRRGELQNWYGDVLYKSSSWCSSYRRLHREREFIPEALSWGAATSHPLALTTGVNNLIELIADYKLQAMETHDARTTQAPDAVGDAARQGGAV